MLTREQAAKLEPNSEAFEQAVDEAGDICEREPKNREAAELLKFLLMRNSDYCISAAYGKGR